MEALNMARTVDKTKQFIFLLKRYFVKGRLSNGSCKF